MKGRGCDCIGENLGGQFAGAGMRRMGLDDDRTAGGESGGGVATRDREGEGEVTGAEDGDGAEGSQHGADVGAREGLAVGERGVDAGVYPGALFDYRGEEAKLVAGAGDFAGEARHGEGGFLVGALGQLLLVGVEAVGATAEEGGLGLARQPAVGLEGSGSLADGLVQFFAGGGVVIGRQWGTGGRVLRLKGLAGLRAAMSTEERCAGKVHDTWIMAREGGGELLMAEWQPVAVPV